MGKLVGVSETTLHRIQTREFETVPVELHQKIQELSAKAGNGGLSLPLIWARRESAKTLYERIKDRGKFATHTETSSFIARACNRPAKTIIDIFYHKKWGYTRVGLIKDLERILKLKYMPTDTYNVGYPFYFDKKGYGFVIEGKDSDEFEESEKPKDSFLVKFTSGKKCRFRKNVCNDSCYKRDMSVLEMQMI